MAFLQINTWIRGRKMISIYSAKAKPDVSLNASDKPTCVQGRLVIGSPVWQQNTVPVLLPSRYKPATAPQ